MIKNLTNKLNEKDDLNIRTLIKSEKTQLLNSQMQSQIDQLEKQLMHSRNDLEYLRTSKSKILDEFTKMKENEIIFLEETENSKLLFKKE